MHIAIVATSSNQAGQLLRLLFVFGPIPEGRGLDLGNLTFDVMAGSDGFVSGIDCLQLNRLARIAGAPLDKGAGIRLFKKIGDRVESGEPLYRVYAFDRSERDLTAAGAKSNSGYAIDRRASSRNKTTP